MLINVMFIVQPHIITPESLVSHMDQGLASECNFKITTMFEIKQFMYVYVLVFSLYVLHCFISNLTDVCVCQLGIAIGFLVPPILVPNVDDLDKLASHIRVMFYITAGVATFLFLLVVIGKCKN